MKQLEKQLCDLNSIGCGALADLIAAAPQAKPIGIGEIGADAADINKILIAGIQRHGVNILRKVIDQAAAGSRCDGCAGFLYRNGTLKTSRNRDGVGTAPVRRCS